MAGCLSELIDQNIITVIKMSAICVDHQLVLESGNEFFLIKSTISYSTNPF